MTKDVLNQAAMRRLRKGIAAHHADMAEILHKMALQSNAETASTTIDWSGDDTPIGEWYPTLTLTVRRRTED